MDRRTLLAAATAAAAATSQALAEGAGDDMHPPRYQALERETGRCVQAANDCLRHCFGMAAMRDTSMAGCAASAFQLVSVCQALQSVSAVNSSHVPALARVVADMCAACQRECDKFPQVAACKACSAACRSCGDECRRVASA